MTLHKGRRRACAALCAALTLAGCGDDNDEIRALSGDSETGHVMKYQEWHQHANLGKAGSDTASLDFIDMETGDEYQWDGGIRDALRYLDYLDRDRCYRNPLGREDAVQVPCG